MKYLPILEELFHSDTVFYFLIGMMVMGLAGLGRGKKTGVAFGVALAVYLICEAVSNVHTNFLVEIIVLLAGTFVLGGAAGLFLCFLAAVWVERGARETGKDAGETAVDGESGK